MAFAVTVQYQIVDASGDVAPAKVKVPTGNSIAQYVEFAQAMAQIIASIIVGRVSQASINFKLSLSGATLKASPLSGANIRNKAMLLFDAATTGFSGKVQIPTYNDVNNIVGSDLVNLADPQIDAFMDAMTQGIDVDGLETIIEPTNGRGMDLVVGRGGSEQFRKKRKRSG